MKLPYLQWYDLFHLTHFPSKTHELPLLYPTPMKNMNRHSIPKQNRTETSRKTCKNRVGVGTTSSVVRNINTVMDGKNLLTFRTRVFRHAVFMIILTKRTKQFQICNNRNNVTVSLTPVDPLNQKTLSAKSS